MVVHTNLTLSTAKATPLDKPVKRNMWTLTDPSWAIHSNAIAVIWKSKEHAVT